MDIDEPFSGVSRSYESYFDTSESNFAWRSPRPREIEQRRAILNDVLLFDILLTLGGIKEPDTLYPPSDVEGLKRLLDAIETSQYDVLKKDCLIYFLLKWHEDGREVAFQQERSILPQFSALADAYWHLDAGVNIARAVSILSDSRLNRDYPSKILQAISHSPNSSPLVLTYVRTAKPLLVEPDDIELYTFALLDASLLEAWQFQRSFAETDPTRPRLLKKIFDWCVTPSPRTAELTQLLALPMSHFEQSTLHSHVTSPPSEHQSAPPAGLAVLQNLICVRLIQAGKYAEAIKMDRLISSQTTSQNSGDGFGRNQMMQDLYSALSHTERTLLDLELEQSANVTNLGSPMSQSWVDIRTSPPRTKPKTQPKPQPNGISTPLSTPLKSSRGILRFGGALSQQTPQDAVAALYKSTTTTNTQPSSSSLPILPLSSSVTRPAPRKSNPLTVGPSTPIRSSLASSSAKFSPFPVFDSASKRSNAFYQPSPSNTQNKTRPFTNDTATTRLSGGTTDGDSFEHVAPEETTTTSFDYSLFSGSRPTNGNTTIAAAATIPSDSSGRAAPPGAFDHDDDDDDDSHLVEQDAPARSTRSHRVSNAKPPLARKARATKSTATKAKEIESSESGSRPSIPGSWDRISDSEDIAEEEGDSVAPLLASAPPARAKRGRASVASSETDDGLEEGKRRRSTRLSTASGEVSSAGRKTRTKDKESKDSGAKSKKTSSSRKKR